MQHRQRIIDVELVNDIWDTYPDLKSYSFRDIRKILKDILSMIMQEVIDNRQGVEFSGAAGHMFMATYAKHGGVKKDRNEKNEYVETGIFPNHPSDGHGVKLYYSVAMHVKRNPGIVHWGFKGCTQFRKMVSDAYARDWKKYIHLPHGWHISSMYTKNKGKLLASKRKKQQLEDYDEFSFE